MTMYDGLCGCGMPLHPGTPCTSGIRWDSKSDKKLPDGANIITGVTAGSGTFRNNMEDQSGLSFKRLHETNVKRCEFSYFPIDEWSPTDWACALAGEVGEACNLIKKMRRGDNIDLNAVAEELADVMIYLDLLSARLGIDLEQAIIDKFNKDSRKRKAEIFLGI